MNRYLKIIFALVAVPISFIAHADDKDTTKRVMVFDADWSMPVFPGGEAAMFKFVNDHINWPKEEFDNNIQGRVVLKFLVKTDGSIGDIRIIRSLTPNFDNELIRIVKSFPNFIPAQMDGKPVEAWYTSSYTFRIRAGVESPEE